MSVPTINLSSAAPKGPKLNPAAPSFKPSTTSLSKAYFSMSVKNGAAELDPENLEQYNKTRRAARRNQHTKLSHDAAQKKRKGRSEEHVQEWKEECWRRWNEKWPEIPSSIFLAACVEEEKRKARAYIEGLKLDVLNERAKMANERWTRRDIDWRVWRMEAKITWYEKIGEIREFMNKAEEKESRRLQNQARVEKKVNEKDDTVRLIRKEQLRKKLEGEREGRIMTPEKLKRDMKEVEVFVAKWEEEFKREDRDARDVERFWIYDEDAWFKKKGIFAEGRA